MNYQILIVSQYNYTLAFKSNSIQFDFLGEMPGDFALKIY